MSGIAEKYHAAPAPAGQARQIGEGPEVTGASITFAERGSHMLNGPPDEWPLFAVTGLGSPGGPALQVGPDAGDAAVQVVQ